MIPVVTPDEMTAIDAATPEPVDVLIERAGAAVARAALEMLGGGYGRRVVVLAGPGNNGADGRACARRMAGRGVKTEVVDVAMAGEGVPAADLYVDAAFGTGLKRSYRAPERAVGTAPVLAVDIPSGVDGLTGSVVEDGRPWPADRTVSFAALKPGLVLEPGRTLAGSVDVVDIGLSIGRPSVHVVESRDVAQWIPRRDPMAHKWTTACRVIGGGPGMTGAATLATSAALKAGAGFVQLMRPGVDAEVPGPVEAVRTRVPVESWARSVIDGSERVAAVLIGPGLGSSAETLAQAAEVVAGCDRPIVVDADALGPATVEALSARTAPAILTPHDGEFARLGGDPDDGDRIRATADLAEAIGAYVVRKGPSTIVAEPGREIRIVNVADQRLATAGSGDVLAGVIVAALARGSAPFDAAAGGAHLHAVAGRLGPDEGLIAGSLVELIPSAYAEVRRS